MKFLKDKSNKMLGFFPYFLLVSTILLSYHYNNIYVLEGACPRVHRAPGLSKYSCTKGSGVLNPPPNTPRFIYIYINISFSHLVFELNKNIRTVPLPSSLKKDYTFLPFTSSSSI